MAQWFKHPGRVSVTMLVQSLALLSQWVKDVALLQAAS